MESEKAAKIEFLLNKETMRELCLEELESVSGGYTASCCIGCNTSVGSITNTATCSGKGSC